MAQSQTKEQLIDDLCKLQWNKLFILQNGSREMQKLRTMIQYLSNVELGNDISRDTLDEIEKFNYSDNNDNAQQHDAKALSKAMLFYEKEYSSNFSISQLEAEIERAAKSKLKLVNSIQEQINEMRETIRLLMNRRISCSDDDDIHNNDDIQLNVSIDTSQKAHLIKAQKTKNKQKINIAEEHSYTENHSYTEIQALFESDICFILMEYCSFDTLINIHKSKILEINNDKTWNEIVNYKMRFNKYINKNEVEQRVMSFMNNNTVKNQGNGFFYGCTDYSMHLWDINIINLEDIYNMKQTQDIIWRNLKTNHQINPDGTRINDKMLSNTKKINKIILDQIKRFDRFNYDIKQKELCITYFIIFFYEIPVGWQTIANHYYKDLRKIAKKIFGRHLFSRPDHAANGQLIEITIDFNHIRIFWIELFVRIYIKYKSLFSIKDIKINFPIFGIYDEQFFKAFHTEFYLHNISDKMDIMRRNTWNELCESYSTHPYNVILKDDPQRYVTNLINTILIPGFVDFESWYIADSYKVTATGDPCWEYNGEKWLLVKMKPPHRGNKNRKLVFWTWRIGYEDLG